MKLKLILFALLAISVVNTSAQKRRTKVQPNASKIIQFGNSVIDLGNSYSQTLKNYQSLLTNADSNMEKITKNPNLSAHFINCNVLTVAPLQQTAYATASKTVQDFPEKSEIIKSVAEGERFAKSIATWCAALSAYNSNKEYKEDKDYIKYKSIRDSLDYYIVKTSISWRLASKKASEAGERAELILLEGSPLASFVIPMKKDLIALNGLFEMFNTESPDIDAIKLKIAEVNKSIDNNKDLSTKDLSKLRDIYYKDVYQTFYRQCSSVVKSLDTVSDRFKEEKLDTDNINTWFASASGDYKRVIEEYNKFVSQ